MKVIPSFTHSDSRRLPLMVAVIVVVLTMLACGGTNTGNTADSSATDTPAGPTPTIDLSFTETFDSLGGWASEASKEVSGNVTDGVYVFNLVEPDSFYWSTADRLVGSGTYEISATAVSGPLNNGFGMMIMWITTQTLSSPWKSVVTVMRRFTPARMPVKPIPPLFLMVGLKLRRYGKSLTTPTS